MKFKKICAILCCVAVAGTGALTGCSSSGSEAEKADSSYDVDTEDADSVLEAAQEDVVLFLTDGAIRSTDTVMTVNGEEVPASYFFYWVASSITDYGYSDSSELDGESDDGATVGEEILDEAQASSAYYYALKQKADDYGITLSEDEEEQTTEYLDSLDDYTLMYYSTSKDAQQKVYEAYLLSLDLQSYLFGEGGEYEVTEEDLEEYMGDNEYVTIDFMYFGTGSDGDTSEAVSRAEAAMAELNEGGYDEMFAEVQEESDYVQEDYTFYIGGGENEDLQNAVQEMEVGDTRVVESDYGVYLVHKKDLVTDTVEEECAYENFYSLLDSWGEEAETEMADIYSLVDVDAFCDRLLTLQDAINEAMEEEADETTDADTDLTEDTGEDVSVEESAEETDTAE